MDRIRKDCIGACIGWFSSGVTFVVRYAPTDTQSVGGKHALWTALERVVKGISGHEQLFALKDANARQIHSREVARQNSLVECYCAPPTAIPTHLGSQHHHTTCETGWSLRVATDR